MNVRARCPEGLDVWEWKTRGGENVHLPPVEGQPYPTDPLKTLCGVVGTETDPVDADATCPACLALAEAEDARGETEGRGVEDEHREATLGRRETPESGDREIDEPAALRRSPEGDEPDRRPRVEVEIGRPGGKKTRATGLIATGAEASFVRTKTAERLGLRRPAGQKWQIRGDSDTKPIDVAEGALSLTDGTAISERMELGCVDDLPAGCDLVIGRDVLAKVTFRYDGESGKATLEAN